MADPALHGNGRACEDCRGGGLMFWRSRATGLPTRVSHVPCPACNGTGRVPIPPAEIVAAQLAENDKGPR